MRMTIKNTSVEQVLSLQLLPLRKSHKMYDSGVRPISSITSQANLNKYQILVIKDPTWMTQAVRAPWKLKINKLNQIGT